MHGVDVTPIMRWDMPSGEVFLGVIEIFILGWLFGAMIAAFYNLGFKESDPRPEQRKKSDYRDLDATNSGKAATCAMQRKPAAEHERSVPVLRLAGRTSSAETLRSSVCVGALCGLRASVPLL